MFNSWDALIRTLIVGSLGYVVVIFLLRISGKRTLSKWNSFDFIVTIAFGSILASLMLSKDISLVQGLVGISTLIFLQFVITYLSVRSNSFQRWIKAEPTLLLYQGQLQHHALRHQRVTESEVFAALRSKGIGGIEGVEAVILEADGSFSVVETIKNSSNSALLDVKGYPRKTAQI